MVIYKKKSREHNRLDTAPSVFKINDESCKSDQQGKGEIIH